MRLTTTLASDIPSELLDGIDRLVHNRFIPLLPGWVQELQVGYSGNECTFEILVEVQYRRVTLSVGSTYAKRTVQQREEAITHEAMHVYTAILEQFCLELIQAAGMEDQQIVNQQFEVSRETAVQDITGLVIALQCKRIAT